MEHGLQEQIIRLVNTAYFVAKYGKPLTDYPRLILPHACIFQSFRFNMDIPK
jgi:hypothetical protein